PFVAAWALVAGVILSSFPTIEVVGSLTTIASRERVTLADGSKGGNSAPLQVRLCGTLLIPPGPPHLPDSAWAVRPLRSAPERVPQSDQSPRRVRASEPAWTAPP